MTSKVGERVKIVSYDVTALSQLGLGNYPSFFPIFAYLPIHFLLYSVIWTIFDRHFYFIPIQKTGAPAAG